MKEIKAIIQPFLADHVISVLREIPEAPGITVSEVTGFGGGEKSGTRLETEQDAVLGRKKIKLEMVVPDALVDKVVEVISKHAHTGNPGDGKIFVYRVDEVVRIRTGERVNEAT